MMRALLILLALLIAAPVAAADHYVRDGGTGDCSDWTNACDVLPATLTRGDTYYIADGTYATYTFDDAESTTVYVYVKKATASAHGTETGWDASYGDGQAVFGGWSFSQGYYDLDGVVGGGPGSWDSGHGFKALATKGGSRGYFNVNVDHVTIAHAELTNTDNTADDTDFGHLIEGESGASDITFRYCKLHHVFGCVLKLSGNGTNDNWTIEYTKLGDNTGTGDNHSEILSTMGADNFTVRYSWLYQWRSSGGLVAINGVEGAYNDQTICEDWNVHGNVFEQGGTTASYVIAAIDDASNQQFARRWNVHNNTFLDINSTAASVYLFRVNTYGETNNYFQNNVIYGNTDRMYVIGETGEDYNSYQGAADDFLGANDALLEVDPFTAYASADYTLSAALAGTSLGAAYTPDMTGATRGADGVWDRGAYEYGGAPPAGATMLGAGGSATLGAGGTVTLQ